MTTFDTGTTDESVINSWNARFQDYEFETPYTYAHVYPVPFGDRSAVRFRNERPRNKRSQSQLRPFRFISGHHTPAPRPARS